MVDFILSLKEERIQERFTRITSNYVDFDLQEIVLNPIQNYSEKILTWLGTTQINNFINFDQDLKFCILYDDREANFSDKNILES